MDLERRTKKPYTTTAFHIPKDQHESGYNSEEGRVQFQPPVPPMAVFQQTLRFCYQTSLQTETPKLIMTRRGRSSVRETRTLFGFRSRCATRFACKKVTASKSWCMRSRATENLVKSGQPGGDAMGKAMMVPMSRRMESNTEMTWLTSDLMLFRNSRMRNSMESLSSSLSTTRPYLNSARLREGFNCRKPSNQLLNIDQNLD
jgi:hypothetical protein